MDFTQPISILFVEDNEINRDMIAMRLQRANHRVTTAENGYQALSLLGAKNFDIVLLDLMMPGLDGFEVLQIIRQRFTLAELPVIVVTALDEQGHVLRALELGANDYVTKPIDLPVLMARMNVHLTLKNLTRLKDDFLRIASHDLKNPLTVLYTASTHMLKQLKVGDTVDQKELDFLTMVTRQIQRMQHIINDFLDLQAAKEDKISLDLSPHQMNALISETLSNVADYAKGKGIKILFHPDETLPLVSVDSRRIMQVLENLVFNALKFSSAGDTITINTQNHAECVSVEISDTGPGLTDDDLQKVFSQYARLSNRPTGGEASSGLGLAICKQMIDLHGGEIGVQNNAQGGSTFWFSVPLA